MAVEDINLGKFYIQHIDFVSSIAHKKGIHTIISAISTGFLSGSLRRT